MPKVSIITGAAIAAFLLLVAVAFGHVVTGFTATCEGMKATFAQFSDSNKPVSWNVSVDTVPKLNGGFTFQGSSGILTASYSQPLPAGDHVVKFVATWPNQGDENGTFSQTVHGCVGPSVPPTTPEQPPVTPAPPTAETPPAAAPPVVNVSTPPPTAVKPTPRDSHPRFNNGKPHKRCAFGRKHLKDSKGRHFTLCRSKPKPPIVRRPQFTG